MLIPADDFFVHQLGEPISSVGDGHPKWFERAYFGIHDRDGRFLLLSGMGSYPNSALADGYASVIADGVQHNVRLSTASNSDRTSMKVGPLEFNVLSPMQKWALQIGPNQQDIMFSLEYTARCPAFLVKKFLHAKPEGPPTVVSHYIQHGVYRGWVEVAGQRMSGEFLGCRDRSWGVRAAREHMKVWLWTQVQFSRFSLTLIYSEARDGSVSYLDGALLYDSGERRPIKSLAHRMEFGEGGVEHTSANLLLRFEDGETLHIRSSRCSRGLYMVGAGYGGWHGVPRGDFHVEGEQWDLSESDLHAKLPYPLYDQLAHFELEGESTIGIFEAGFSRSSKCPYVPTW